MDFMNRAVPNQPQSGRPIQQQEQPSQQRAMHSAGKNIAPAKDLLALGSHIGTNALLFIVALLIAALAWFIYSSRPASQANLVDNSRLQAVFLNTGQVYFGNVQALNPSYLVLGNVYYLQSSNGNQQTQANQNVSLVKLGCELHKPFDQMVINMNEVTFWENLQPDGQVGKAVAQFQQQNPNGQKCSDQAAPATNGLQNQGTSNTSPTKP